MTRPRTVGALVIVALLVTAAGAAAQEPFGDVAAAVNRKLVKLYGADLHDWRGRQRSDQADECGGQLGWLLVLGWPDHRVQFEPHGTVADLHHVTGRLQPAAADHFQLRRLAAIVVTRRHEDRLQLQPRWT